MSTPSEISMTDAAGVGLSDPEHANVRRQLFDLVKRIRDTGVDAYLDIPVIAAIGSQSAGKSSLIEAISGITLPRKSGTCTRCPTECQLSYADEAWKCVVSLRRTSGSHGAKLSETQNIQFGPIITDKADVTERIRRAQRAILNPSKDWNSFLSGPEDDSAVNEVSFSSNCIVLEIRGKEMADLHFVDLPGLIAGGVQSEMDLIEGLTRDYIQKPSCIILLTVACETDFENQRAHRLAEKCDPEGARTIGVLTKPDRIPPTEEENWLRLIRGSVRGGIPWFCVKRPNSQSINAGITWEEARHAETAFFTGQSPWSHVESAHKEHLGTPHLTSRLSEILSALIAERLPHIQEELEKALLKTQEEIDGLPPPPSNEPITEIVGIIGAFMREVVKQTDGVPRKDGLLQTIRPAQAVFKKRVRATAPDFRPYRRNDVHPPSIPEPAFLSNEEALSAPSAPTPAPEVEYEEGGPIPEFEDEECGPIPEFVDEVPRVPEVFKPYYEAPVEAERPVMPAFIYRRGTSIIEALPDVNDIKPYEPKTLSRGERADEPSGSIAPREDDDLLDSVRNGEPEADVDRRIFVDDVMERAEWAVTRELPNNYPFIVQKSMIIDCVKRWRRPSRTLFSKTKDELTKCMQQIVADQFGHVGSGALKQRVSNLVTEHLASCAHRTAERLDFLMKVESEEPYTGNTRYFCDYRDKFFNLYKGVYRRETNGTFITNITSAGHGLTQIERDALHELRRSLNTLGLYDFQVHSLAALAPADHMEPALKIMADVRAYFQVAYKRYVDDVPLAIDQELVRGLREGLEAAISSGIGINKPDGYERCKNFLREPAAIGERRNELEGKKKRLLKAKEELLDSVFM
ncbi:hypothetical protein FA95DRAFT_1607639 [Auriscalpium vulgare]|uniref:Uncharacterized protein n=1 Tax=Auriscalpium vulgare TaxID=40419 RepID=A0ACB8RMX3_9AGAM|nr:hypothetical protein FA95DRAFT_1607639 [Auriscalpium vulgare]